MTSSCLLRGPGPSPQPSPKGRGSNAGQFAVARFEVTHFGSLSPRRGERVGVRGLSKITPISPDASEIHIDFGRKLTSLQKNVVTASKDAQLSACPARVKVRRLRDAFAGADWKRSADGVIVWSINSREKYAAGLLL